MLKLNEILLVKFVLNVFVENGVKQELTLRGKESAILKKRVKNIIISLYIWYCGIEHSQEGLLCG